MGGSYSDLNTFFFTFAIILLFSGWTLYYACPFICRRHGARRFNEGRFMVASACFKRALFFSPRDSSLWFCYALALRRSSRLDASVEALQRAVALKPDECQFYYECADTLCALGRYTTALDVLHRVELTRRPTVELVLTRAAIELEARRFRDVERDCQWLVRHGGDLLSAQAYCILGIMKILTGRTEEGEFDLDVSYLLDPQSSITRAYCAAILYHRGMNRQTVRLCDAIIKTDPRCAIAYYYRGVANRRIGACQESERDLAKSQHIIAESQNDDACRKDRFFVRALERIEQAILGLSDSVS